MHVLLTCSRWCAVSREHAACTMWCKSARLALAKVCSTPTVNSLCLPASLAAPGSAWSRGMGCSSEAWVGARLQACMRGVQQLTSTAYGRLKGKAGRTTKQTMPPLCHGVACHAPPCHAIPCHLSHVLAALGVSQCVDHVAQGTAQGDGSIRVSRASGRSGSSSMACMPSLTGNDTSLPTASHLRLLLIRLPSVAVCPTAPVLSCRSLPAKSCRQRLRSDERDEPWLQLVLGLHSLQNVAGDTCTLAIASHQFQHNPPA